MTLEKLLNILCEKGWKPFGIEYSIHIHYYEFNDVSLYRIETTIWWKEFLWRRISHSLRDIASAESWLWQFVCENEMIDNRLYLNERNKYYEFEMSDVVYIGKDYQYRLLESSLKDESELEQFLLNNIKL